MSLSLKKIPGPSLHDSRISRLASRLEPTDKKKNKNKSGNYITLHYIKGCNQDGSRELHTEIEITQRNENYRN